MENECPNDNGTDTALPNESIDMTTEQEASNYKKRLIEFHELGARSDTFAPLVASRNAVAESQVKIPETYPLIEKKESLLHILISHSPEPLQSNHRPSFGSLNAWSRKEDNVASRPGSCRIHRNTDKIFLNWLQNIDKKLFLMFLAACLIILGGGLYQSLSIDTYLPSKSETRVYLTDEPIVSNFEGWGTSLAWWAEFVGTLEPERQDQVLNMIFSNSSSESLKLNIVRFNIGGSGPHNNITGATPSDVKLREWRGVPSFLQKNGTYDWNADEAQINVLKRAKDFGVNIFEAFSNSPPWFMTISKSARGHPTGHDNLDPSNYTAFADYLATVVKESSVRWGISFDYLEPFNEPNSEWWKSTMSVQEGCGFSPAAQAAFMPYLVEAMKRQGVWNKTKISVADTWSIEAAVRNINEGGALDNVEKVNVHGYGYSNGAQESNVHWWNSLRQRLRTRITSRIQHVWMSEVGGYGFGSDALTKLSLSIIQDMNLLRVTSWIWWQVMDPAPSWALIVVSSRWPWWLSRWNYYPKRTLSFYVLQQFSAHIRPGDSIISTSRSQYTGLCVICTVVAYSKNESRLTIVLLNSSEKPVSHSVTLFQREQNISQTSIWTSNGTSPAQVKEAYRTCDWRQEYHQQIRFPNVSLTSWNESFISTNLPAYSVTTFVLSNVHLSS